MKMTMHIDEALLARVMETHGYETKTDAVEGALREMDRRARLAGFGREGLGLTPDELRNAVDPDYDLMASRIFPPNIMLSPVLIDSSVFLRLLRDGQDPGVALSRWAGERDLAIYGTVEVEVLRGVREPVRRPC